MKTDNLSNCPLIDLPKISDLHGNLTLVEEGYHMPSAINRIFYFYDVLGGADRGGHALKNCPRLLIAMSGSFEVRLNDGTTKNRIHLNCSYRGLLIPPMIWKEMDTFSSGAVCLVLASKSYLEEGCYREYADFLGVGSGSITKGRWEIEHEIDTILPKPGI